jgi:phosphoribosylamine--glycine ligase
MNVLIVGSGGREYSIGLALSKEEKVNNIYFAPGNGATENIGKNIKDASFDNLIKEVKTLNIDLTIVGPEAPLVDGIVDKFKSEGLTIFGPSAAAARLEGSKAYMKNILAKYNIPTAAFLDTDNITEAFNFIDTFTTTPIVVKTDGLAAGKGVIIAQSKDEAKKTVSEMLSGNAFGDSGKRVVIEEFLDGYELSIFAVCDGEDYIVLPAAQDHKRLLDNDQGPNTGGMGAYAPTPLVNDKIYNDVEEKVIKPTLSGMKNEGAPFEGILFIGLMIVNGEVKVLEYNVRFGDPECEIIIPLMKSSVYDLFYKGATKDLKNFEVEFEEMHAVGVVMASGGYPTRSAIPAEIIVDDVVHENIRELTHISYAGVSKEDDKLYATGGRVLVCVGKGKTIQDARDNAYALCGQVHFANKQLRTDIAYQALNQ